MENIFSREHTSWSFLLSNKIIKNKKQKVTGNILKCNCNVINKQVWLFSWIFHFSLMSLKQKKKERIIYYFALQKPNFKDTILLKKFV